MRKILIVKQRGGLYERMRLTVTERYNWCEHKRERERERVGVSMRERVDVSMRERVDVSMRERESDFL